MEGRDLSQKKIENSYSGDIGVQLDPELEKLLEGNHLKPLRSALADAGIFSLDGFFETDLLSFMIERGLYVPSRCKAIMSSLRAKIEKAQKDREKQKASLKNPVLEKITSKEDKLDPLLEELLTGDHLEPLRNALADAGIFSLDRFFETDLLSFMIERELYSPSRCKAIMASLGVKIEKARQDRETHKATEDNPLQEKRMTTEERSLAKTEQEVECVAPKTVIEDVKDISNQSKKTESIIAQIEELPISISQKAYLKCIAKLTVLKQWTRQNEIADSLGYSKASVSVAIKQLRSEGYIIDEGGYIKLNEDKLDAHEQYEDSQSEEIRSKIAKIEELPVSLSQKEYLKCIAKLYARRRIIRRTDIANAMGISRASVTMAIKQLLAMDYIIEEDGYIELNEIKISGSSKNDEINQESIKEERSIEQKELKSDENCDGECSTEDDSKSSLDNKEIFSFWNTNNAVSDCSRNQDTLIDSLSISESQKEYLKCIVKLKKGLGSVRQRDLADTLGYSRGAVSVAVYQLRSMGFVEIENGFITPVDLTILDRGELLFKQVTGIQKKYLYSIAKLSENGSKVRQSDIAKDLGCSRAAVTLGKR